MLEAKQSVEYFVHSNRIGELLVAFRHFPVDAGLRAFIDLFFTQYVPSSLIHNVTHNQVNV